MFKRSIVLAAAAAALLCAVAAPAGATTAHAAVVRTSVVVGGRPFFPVMLIDQCAASDVARAHTLGVNLILNESCPGVSPSAQLGRLVGRQLGVLPIQARGTSGARLAGWTYPDEPENNGWTPTRLAQTFHYPRGSDDGLVSFVTTTSSFLHGNGATVRAIARLADVAGFDLYPLNHCQSNLETVYDAQRAFVRLVGSMPTFQWIETGPLRQTYCGGFQMTPQQLTAEAWLAVAGGARGIGFFTHTLDADRELDVSKPIAHALWRFASLAAAVEPGLVGATVPSSSNSPAIKVLARTAGGRTYVFAVNAELQHVKAQLNVAGLHDGSIRAFGEQRAVAVSGHALVDTWPPLGVHVYVEGG
jgi:hypothetical protein